MGFAALGVGVGIVFYVLVLWPMERNFARRNREIAEAQEARRRVPSPASSGIDQADADDH